MSLYRPVDPKTGDAQYHFWERVKGQNSSPLNFPRVSIGAAYKVWAGKLAQMRPGRHAEKFREPPCFAQPLVPIRSLR
jgi:hypothetical protein